MIAVCVFIIACIDVMCFSCDCHVTSFIKELENAQRQLEEANIKAVSEKSSAVAMTIRIQYMYSSEWMV